MQLPTFCAIKDTISTVIVLFSIYAVQCSFANAKNMRDGSEESKEGSMYKNCGDSNSKKMCFGESRHCIERKSCTLLATVTDTGSRFNISFLDKCKRDMNDSIFFATAVAIFNDKGELDCSKKLTMTDIKVFILWKEKLCRGGRNSQATFDNEVTKSGYMAQCERKERDNYGKKLINSLDKYNSSSEIDLNLYLNNFVLFSQVSGGAWREANRPFTFPSNISYATLDQVFYTSIDDRHHGGHNGAPSFPLGNFPLYWIVLAIIMEL